MTLHVINLSVDELEVPELTEKNDEVDMTAFWRQIALSIVARGLLRGTRIIRINHLMDVLNANFRPI